MSVLSHQSVFTGGVVLLAIGVLSPGFDYIPRTALAAIIIAAVLPVVELRIVCRITKLRCELWWSAEYFVLVLFPDVHAPPVKKRLVF